MNIEINKSDIHEHLWFQRLLEARLHKETLRRAIEAGHVPPDTKDLWCFEVTMENWMTESVDACYRVQTGDRRPYDRKTYYESYTLAEILHIAMKDPS